jgi:hypothetical protein
MFNSSSPKQSFLEMVSGSLPPAGDEFVGHERSSLPLPHIHERSDPIQS